MKYLTKVRKNGRRINNVAFLGTKLPEFNLVGIDEKNYKNSDFSENNGLLVMFICNHCPFVKHINKELVDFTNDLMAKILCYWNKFKR